MAKILIKNGRVWDGEQFWYADVLTNGDKIAKIEPDICQNADFIYDAKGKIVSAGLVDAHVHMRGISSEEFGIQAEMSCFPFGVTAAVDAGGGKGDKSLLDSFMVKNAVFVSVGLKNNHADFTQTEVMLADYGDKAIGLKVYFDTTISEASDVTPLREACEFASWCIAPILPSVWRKYSTLSVLAIFSRIPFTAQKITPQRIILRA